MEENQMKERKEMILSLMNEPSYVPMKIKELAILLEVPKERREELKEVLDALLEEGRILGFYGPSQGLRLCFHRRAGGRRFCRTGS